MEKLEEQIQPENTYKQDTEFADAKLRSLEPAEAKPEPIPDVYFSDKSGRAITIRTWESGNQAYVRAYDTNKLQVPEMVSPGQAGNANATLEQMPDSQTRVRLNEILTSPEYRNAGIGNQMLSRKEQFAKNNKATDIYGSVDSQDAQHFWQNQADHGWSIDYSKGANGEIHKTIR